MYLEIDEGFPEHPKTLQLCASMESPTAFAYLINFWRWACRSCQYGDLHGMSAYAIEEAAKYYKHDGRLYAAMVAKLGDRAGFLDADESGAAIHIHNWEKRTGSAIQKMEAEAQRKREYRAGKPWDVVRLEILERDKYTCTRCGSCPEDRSTIDVHHKIPLRKFENKKAGNNPSNLTSLCETCHAKAEKEYRDSERASAGRRQDRDTLEQGTDQGTADTVKSSQVKSSQDQTSTKPEKTICAETPAASSPPADPPVLTFPCDGEPKCWHLTQSQVDHWKELFPSRDILADCRAALAWIEAKPDRRKTARGMPACLVGWFGRAQNRGQQTTMPQGGSAQSANWGKPVTMADVEAARKKQANV